MTDIYCKKCNNLIRRHWGSFNSDWEHIHEVIANPLLEVNGKSYSYMLPEPIIFGNLYQYLPVYVVKKNGKTKLEDGNYCQTCYNKYI